MKRILALAALAALLAACATPPPPLPLQGPILYSCANGDQLSVEFEAEEARVAIVGGRSLVLPRLSEGYYTNGRYGIRGGGRSASWEIGRMAPIACSGQ